MHGQIFIGSEEDVVSTQSDHTAFVYTAQQGEFSLKLPSECVYMINTDTTVEFIAQHIANKLKQQNPTDSFTVKAYEGLAKGAIASS